MKDMDVCAAYGGCMFSVDEVLWLRFVHRWHHFFDIVHQFVVLCVVLPSPTTGSTFALQKTCQELQWQTRVVTNQTIWLSCY